MADAIACPPESPTMSTTTTDGVKDVKHETDSSNTTNKSYPMIEVARHTKASDCWFVIDGEIYNVTPFLDEHPGGEDVLIDCSGSDATRQFEDVGHSDEARAQLKDLRVGRLREPTEEEVEKDRLERAARGEKEIKSGSGSVVESILKWTMPIILIGIAYLIRKYTT